MGWKALLSLIAVLFLCMLLFFYFFIPYSRMEFYAEPANSNFSLSSYTESMQFYPNMRFPESRISYRVDEKCPLKKKNDMEDAFGIVQRITVLDFYPVDKNEQVIVTCDERRIFDEGLFVAGEGGPTKIIAGSRFNVILNGSILLVQESKCENPNIAIHELFHVLGFNHSLNPSNIMYNITKCSQTIGDDIPRFINEIYSVPSFSDLDFANVSASMEGRYLNLNMTVRNIGLKDSEKAEIKIYADDRVIKEIDLNPIKLGEGRIITLKNIWISRINVEELEFIIDTDFNELEKENNKIKLKIKK